MLAGATQVLKEADYVILETSLFQFFVGGKQLHDVIEYMHAASFVTYDLVGYIYRLLDGALAQMDLAFVKEEGIFRRQHVYASPPQRAAQNKQFQEGQRKALARQLNHDDILAPN